jgi:hypothetical protein
MRTSDPNKSAYASFCVHLVKHLQGLDYLWCVLIITVLFPSNHIKMYANEINLTKLHKIE